MQDLTERVAARIERLLREAGRYLDSQDEVATSEVATDASDELAIEQPALNPRGTAQIWPVVDT